MKQKLSIFFTILLYLHHVQSVCDSIWSFDCHEQQLWTHLINKNDINFSLLSLRKETNNLKITDSDIKILDKDLCHASNVPNLEMLWFRGVGLQKLTENALENCNKLTVVKLGDNNLGDGISKNAFKNNDKLEEIWLQDNKITRLEFGTFNHLANLIVLDLGGNSLKYFPHELVVGLKNLRLLALYSNDLVELDGAGLMGNLPALDYFYFNDNCLKCSSIKEIIEPFKARYVTVSTHADYKIRSFIVQYSHGLTCVGEDEESMEEGTTEFIKPRINHDDFLYLYNDSYYDESIQRSATHKNNVHISIIISLTFVVIGLIY